MTHDHAEYRSRADYDRDAGRHTPMRQDRDRSYARAFSAEGAIPGWCTVCERATRFAYAPPADDTQEPPNFREMLHCANCGLFSRIRHALAVADALRPLCSTRIYATEMATLLYAWLRREGHDVIGSEFVHDSARRAALDRYVATITGGLDTGLRVEDVTRLTLGDESRDLVLSFDVLEHVPDYRAALREFHRVLAPGGALVATIPFDTGRDETLVRASLADDGSIVHHVEAEYHGDPASDDGCLAFYTFGWSLFDELRAAGFADPRWVVAYSPAHGWLGAQWTLVAEKRADGHVPDPDEGAADGATTASGPDDVDEYSTRVAQEGCIFDRRLVVHDLPPIFHYWSNRWLLPMEQAMGYDHPYDFFARELAKVAARKTGTARFVSLGCGNADAEIDVALRLRALGVHEFTIDCLDLSEPMLERGRALAAERGVSDHIVPVSGDFNRWTPAREYDAVVANQSLHHVLELEHLFEQIHRTLPPHGRFVTSDMIGRNGHQRWPEALERVREFWRELPASHPFNVPLQRQEDEFLDWDCSTEGFEGIRAQDILPLCVDRFGFEVFLPFGNVVDPFIDRCFGHHFDVDGAWDRAFIDRIHACDEAGFRDGTLTPTHMMAVMTADRASVPRIRDGLTPRGCVRSP